MSKSRSARNEYMEAMAEFELGLRNFSRGMAGILDVDGPADPTTPLMGELGPRKPMKRSSSRTHGTDASSPHLPRTAERG